MWLLAVLACILLWTVVMEVPPLWKKRRAKMLTALGLLVAAETAFCLMLAFRAPLPNPLDWMAFLFRPLSLLFDALLG